MIDRSSRPARAVVSTPCGLLSGQGVQGVASFKGIPYAEPPVGPLRWRAPVAAKRWEGERPAVEFGPAPIQDQPVRSSLLYRLHFDDRKALVMSEDCLYLNVWTPEPSSAGQLPVLFSVHGGGNRYGHGGLELNDGARLASRGTVVVTVNMRLGALGLMSLPGLADENHAGASGNYCLQDLLKALAWVQANISVFGGDPDRVTMVGSSAGASLVTHLMAAPSARSLFQAAVVQSGSGVCQAEGPMVTSGESHEAADVVNAVLGTTNPDVLRDLPATAFLRLPRQSVVVDGQILVEDTTDAFRAGRQLQIPLLAGTVKDEGGLFVGTDGYQGQPRRPTDPEGRAQIDAAYPQEPAEVRVQSHRAWIGDLRFTWPVHQLVRLHAATSGAPTWLYRFDHSPPLPSGITNPADGGGGYGAFHTSELPYTWDNLGARNWDWTDADRSLARMTADTWVRFIALGDPNGPDLEEWEQVDPSGEIRMMSLGTEPRMMPGDRAEAMAVLAGEPGVTRPSWRS